MPSFGRSPRLDVEEGQTERQPGYRLGDSPASQQSSRFGRLHDNVRSMVNGSSVYSDSPAPSNNNTPKLPFLGFLHRPRSPPEPIVLPDNEPPRGSSDSRSPLRPQHTAGSYMRVIAPPEGDLRQPSPVLDRHPADVPLGIAGSVDPETHQLQEDIHGRRRKRRHRRRKQNRPTHWVRRKSDKGVCFPFMKSRPARGKIFACIISGLFLMTVLTIYLTLALTRSKTIGQEVHVLFIMIILATTIFFCHSLIRLCMLALHPPPDTPHIPSMTGPDGFHPVRPIRVHLARDEELADDSDSPENPADDAEKLKVAPPPPAYGLWRSSVRVDPNLLHWQRVEHPASNNSSTPDLHSSSNSRNGSVSGAAGPAGHVIASQQQQPQEQQQQQGPRPPSYVSEDGVSYVVEAAPRSTAPASSGVSDIHPAWRPGFAVAEVHALTAEESGRGGRW
ncbi:hypothetical protein EJ04DRAFT_434341 [Polyplosphaeria fusca]|uniref:Uncharacterized protein n=1 Tax=Polyplosphaeria fusca TaxID=682080 RepID=A0A9P4QXG5_9PLEO|nr:hypothetical protein EJ04DRAFT_434341 [Polyplosphaeria fusca]